MARSNYNTKQKDLLASYLKETGGKHFTVEDVRKHFASKNCEIGVATVYRYLEKMIGEGVVSKYIIDEHSAACFQYLDEKECDRKHEHFHLKCEVCGKLIHLESKALSFAQNKIDAEYGFSVDPKRTVLYGVCSDCNEK